MPISSLLKPPLNANKYSKLTQRPYVFLHNTELDYSPIQPISLPVSITHHHSRLYLFRPEKFVKNPNVRSSTRMLNGLSFIQFHSLNKIISVLSQPGVPHKRNRNSEVPHKWPLTIETFSITIGVSLVFIAFGGLTKTMPLKRKTHKNSMVQIMYSFGRPS